MSGGIGGVSWQTFNRLPPEDQQAIRDSVARQEAVQSEPAAPASAPGAETPPALKPAEAKTPEQAVASINDLPLPKTDDLNGMPAPVYQSIYQPRVTQFTTTRREEAQAALDRFEPKWEDYRDSGLNGATASYEYGEARDAFNDNPYVKELKRIVGEATDKPTEVPAYLRNDPSTRTNPEAVTNLPIDTARTALKNFGVELPPNPTPQQIAAGYELLGAMPQDLLAYAINPGTQVTYNAPLGGIGTPSFIPVRAEAGFSFEGKVELSDVQTGVDFQETQQFKTSVQLQSEAGVDVGKTPLNKLYRAATLLRQVSPEAKELIEGSPLLKNVVKGLPISGHYTEFEGTRLSYEATVTTQQGTKLAGGDMSGMPNPLDPLNMPTGTSVLMRGQDLQGSDFAVNYKAFTLAGNHTELDGAGFGVRKLEGSVVEVYAGPIQTVENATFFGLGRAGTAAIGLSVDTSMENRSLSTARIDLATPEGQQAYQNFMNGGRVPDWNPPGVQRSGTSEVLNAEHATRLGIDLGPLSWQAGGNSQLTITRNVWQDGTIDQQNTYTSADGMTSDVQFQVGRDGKPIDSKTEWKIVLSDFNPILTSYLNAAYRPDQVNKDFDGEQHVQLEFTSAELMELRDRSRAHVGSVGGKEHLADLDSGRVTPWNTNVAEHLAVAKTSDEVFAVLSNDFHTSQIPEDLLAMVFEQGNRAVPGTIRLKDAG
ncbi:hypothetical protein [Lysobacter antibioticus]|uniref:hypothetical protein n=1 Tax=Lysobacter antibioticus TaxID=84531 RepID=UPI0003492F46|nr:hypothetical protein [Lysobacter antibioticus]